MFLYMYVASLWKINFGSEVLVINFFLYRCQHPFKTTSVDLYSNCKVISLLFLSWILLFNSWTVLLASIAIMHFPNLEWGQG